MTISNTPSRKETDFIIGDVHGLGAELMQQASVIFGGNAAGKSALVEAQLAARRQHDASESATEGAVVHILEVQRAITDKGNIPRHAYPRANPCIDIDFGDRLR